MFNSRIVFTGLLSAFLFFAGEVSAQQEAPDVLIKRVSQEIL